MTFNGSDCWTNRIWWIKEQDEKQDEKNLCVPRPMYSRPFCAICACWCVCMCDDNSVTEKFKPNYASIKIWELPWQFRHSHNERNRHRYIRGAFHVQKYQRQVSFYKPKKKKNNKKRAHMRHIANDIVFHISNQNALWERYDMSSRPTERAIEWVSEWVS